MTTDKKITELNIYINHFMNISTKDVDAYFPNSNGTVRAILKESVAAMFNLDDINELESLYECLQIIWMSKYSNDRVKMVLNGLESFIAGDKKKEKEDENNEQEEGGENEILFYDETITYNTQFESSLFYQNFKKLTKESTIFVRSNVVNNFYCPSFAILFLQKYMAILPLWTRINNGDLERLSNSHVENYNNLLKHDILVPLEVGKLPTKTSRVLKATKKFNDKAMQRFLLRIPMTKVCGNARPGRVKVKTPKRLAKTQRFGTPKLGRQRTASPRASTSPRTPTSSRTPRSTRTSASSRTPTSTRTQISALTPTSTVASPRTPKTTKFLSSR